MHSRGRKSAPVVQQSLIPASDVCERAMNFRLTRTPKKKKSSFLKISSTSHRLPYSANLCHTTKEAGFWTSYTATTVSKRS
jgi:hypothetical protein